MTDREENLGLRLSALVLALLTIAALVFGIFNFQQRLSFDVPEDGVSWVDTGHGVEALSVEAGSPAARVGLKPGDQVVSINGVPIHRAVDVVKRLWVWAFGLKRTTRLRARAAALMRWW